MRHERRDAMLRGAFAIKRSIGKVTQNSARGGVLPCPAPIIQSVANNIAAHVNRVEDFIHVRENVRIGNKRRVNRNLDFATLAGILAGAFHNAEQLDRITELLGKLNVEPRNLTNAFDVNVLGIHPKTMRERSE